MHDLHDLPLRRFLDAGVAITVNSDDPAYFGGYIAANYEAMASVGFTLDELSRLAENSIRATFLPNADKQALLDELDGWKARHLGDECPAS